MNLEISQSNPVAGQTYQAGREPGALMDLEQVPPTGDELRTYVKMTGFGVFWRRTNVLLKNSVWVFWWPCGGSRIPVVFGFFLYPHHSFCWEGNEQLYQCMFHSANFFFFLLTNPVWKSKRTQKLWNASSLWGADFFSKSRWAVTQLVDLDGFLPPPGSGLDSVLMSWVFIQVMTLAWC